MSDFDGQFLAMAERAVTTQMEKAFNPDIALRKWCVEQAVKVVAAEIAAQVGELSTRDIAEQLYEWVTKTGEPTP